MSDVVYTSNARIERIRGPIRLAYLPGESQPVTFSVHGAIAEHYKVDPSTLGEAHASTIDYPVLAGVGLRFAEWTGEAPIAIRLCTVIAREAVEVG